jgi:hypothetical protein
LLERNYQPHVIDEIAKRLPGALVQKLDTGYQQGIPDLLILWHDMWAILEVKKARNAKHEPNQDYFVDRLNDMSFSAFIYPENEEAVLDALEQEFKSRWAARGSQSEHVPLARLRRG